MNDKEIIDCPNCSQRLSVPSGSGVLAVTCPSCRFKWDWAAEVESIAEGTSTVAAEPEPEPRPIGSSDACTEHPELPVPKTNIDERIERFVPKPPSTQENGNESEWHSYVTYHVSTHSSMAPVGRFQRFINHTHERCYKSPESVEAQIERLRNKGYYAVVLNVVIPSGADRYSYSVENETIPCLIGVARTLQGAQAIEKRQTIDSSSYIVIYEPIHP